MSNTEVNALPMPIKARPYRNKGRGRKDPDVRGHESGVP